MKIANFYYHLSVAYPYIQYQWYSIVIRTRSLARSLTHYLVFSFSFSPK